MKKILCLFLTLCSFSGMVHSDISWGTPTSISTASVNASDPHVVIDNSGNVTAAWVESGVIQSSSLPYSGSWSSIVSISDISNSSSSPKLAIDASGNVTALWIEVQSGNAVIESATLPFGGSWGSETSPISGAGASAPSLAVDSTGNAVAVWVRSNYIESSTRISGTWSLVSILSAVNSSNAHVAISDSGKAVAVWHTTAVSGADQLYSDFLTISTNTWSTPLSVLAVTAGVKHNYPKVAIDPYGNATMAWYRYELLDGNSYQEVTVLSSDLSVDSAAWTAIPTVLSGQGIRNPVDLNIKLRFDSSGDILGVWTNSYDGMTFNIETARRLYGAIWPGEVQPGTPTLYSFAFDHEISSGTALLLYMQWDGVSNITIQSQETETTDPTLQAWSNPNQMSTTSENGYPVCGISLLGSNFNGVTLWISNNGTNNEILACFGSAPVTVPPTSLSATQSSTNFGIYTDYYNTFTWVDSTDPTAIQYNLFRNGVFFNEVNPGTEIFVDHNQAIGGGVVYGVAMLNADYRQSAIVTYTLP